MVGELSGGFNWLALAFYVLATIIVVSALLVVFARDIVHSVLWLAVCFVAIGGLFLTLNADFLAAVQVMVYAGAAVSYTHLASMQLRMRAIQAGMAASESVLQSMKQRVKTLGLAVQAAVERRLSGACEQVRYLSALAEERSPMRILSRGYSLTSSKRGPVSSVDQVRVGELLFSRLADGEIISQVIETRGVEHGKDNDA